MNASEDDAPVPASADREHHERCRHLHDEELDVEEAPQQPREHEHRAEQVEVGEADEPHAIGRVDGRVRGAAQRPRTRCRCRRRRRDRRAAPVTSSAPVRGSRLRPGTAAPQAGRSRSWAARHTAAAAAGRRVVAADRTAAAAAVGRTVAAVGRIVAAADRRAAAVDRRVVAADRTAAAAAVDRTAAVADRTAAAVAHRATRWVPAVAAGSPAAVGSPAAAGSPAAVGPAVGRARTSACPCTDRTRSVAVRDSWAGTGRSTCPEID